MRDGFKNGFDPKSEILYKQESIERKAIQTRKTFIVFMLIFLLFVAFDIFLNVNNFTYFSLLRYALLPALFIITIILSYIDFFVKFYQKIILINLITMGSTAAIMLILYPNNFSYYGGIFLIIFSGYLILEMDFAYATTGGWFISLIYIVGFYIYHEELNQQLIFPSLFFISANILGMIGSYNIEKASRNSFLKFQKIQKYSEELKEKVDVQVNEINNLHMESVFALAKLVETRDKFTSDHIERVSILCKITAEGIDPEHFFSETLSREKFIETIEIASILHDIGKVSVEDSILNKKDKLTSEEYSKMKSHTVIGADILESVRKFHIKNQYINMGIDITRHHHERWDGKGYPDGIKGKDIPLSARIMAVVDVYDALTTERPYKRAYTHEKAIHIMQMNSGTQFDSYVFETFKEQVERLLLENKFIKENSAIISYQRSK